MIERKPAHDQDTLGKAMEVVKTYVEIRSKKDITEGEEIWCDRMLSEIAQLYRELPGRDQITFIKDLSSQASAIVPHLPNLKAARLSNVKKQTYNAFIPGGIGGVGSYVIPEILVHAASSSAEVSLLACCFKIGISAFLGGVTASTLVGAHTMFNGDRYSAEQLGRYSAQFNQYNPYDEIQNKLGINLIPAKAPASMAML